MVRIFGRGRRSLLIRPSSAVYSSHLRRQEADLKVFMEDESLALDPHLDYGTVEGLSSEVRERLARVRPTSIVSAAVCFGAWCGDGC